MKEGGRVHRELHQTPKADRLHHNAELVDAQVLIKLIRDNARDLHEITSLRVGDLFVVNIARVRDSH